MYLTKEEEKILEGEEGFARQKAMEILVALGDIYGASNLIDIEGAQVSGVSYKTIGDAGLDFLDEFSKDAKVKVPTTLNPAGMDLEEWKSMNVNPEFASKQLEILKCFDRMGLQLTCTCTPYLIGNIPSYNSHVSWGESSAIVFANSILGARTNREGGMSSLASALIGKTPNYGLHLDESRGADFLIQVEEDLNTYMYGVLGYHVGKITMQPAFIFSKRPSLEGLKLLCASLGASGSVALFHAKDITPEWRGEFEKLEKIEVTRKELEEEQTNFRNADKIDLITFGCPHCTINEIINIKNLLEKEKEKPNCEVWIFTNYQTKKLAERMGLKESLKKKNAKIISDTCMIVSPIEEMGIKSIATNSTKACLYAPTMCGFNVYLGDERECIRLGMK
ncbi:MAG: aconitase X catalytic domain-containing protein [Candidatus Hydrothermarchaeota archaeon]